MTGSNLPKSIRARMSGTAAYWAVEAIQDTINLSDESPERHAMVEARDALQAALSTQQTPEAT